MPTATKLKLASEKDLAGKSPTLENVPDVNLEVSYDFKGDQVIKEEKEIAVTLPTGSNNQTILAEVQAPCIKPPQVYEPTTLNAERLPSQPVTLDQIAEFLRTASSEDARRVQVMAECKLDDYPAYKKRYLTVGKFGKPGAIKKERFMENHTWHEDGEYKKTSVLLEETVFTDKENPYDFRLVVIGPVAKHKLANMGVDFKVL